MTTMDPFDRLWADYVAARNRLGAADLDLTPAQLAFLRMVDRLGEEATTGNLSTALGCIGSSVVRTRAPLVRRRLVRLTASTVRCWGSCVRLTEAGRTLMAAAAEAATAALAQGERG